MQAETGYRPDELWQRELVDEAGNHLGRVEAIGIDRQRRVRRVGFRPRVGEPGLRFVAAARIRRRGEVLVLKGEPPARWRWSPPPASRTLRT